MNIFCFYEISHLLVPFSEHGYDGFSSEKKKYFRIDFIYEEI